MVGCEGFLNLERQVDRDPNELDGQPGPSPYVSIRQLSKGVLEFKEVAEFPVQRPNASAAGCANDIKGLLDPITRFGGTSKVLTESALTYRVKRHQNRLNTFFTKLQ